MIKSYGDKATSDIFHCNSSSKVRKLPTQNLEPMGLNQKKLTDHLDILTQRVNEIERCKRGVSPNTAWLRSEAFDTSPEFRLNLKSMHDLSLNCPDRHIKSLKTIQV